MFQEGLTAVTFNAAFYLDANADLQEAFGDLSGDALDARLLQHFIEFGQFEGRDPNEFFDTSYYLAENGDVLAAIGNPANTAVTSAFQHFVMFGAAEGIVRAPSAPFESFNAETYLAANPDLQAAFASVPAAQLPNVLFQHFVTFGVNEDRPGTGLDEGSQLAARLAELADANADVADALEAAALAVNAQEDTPLTGSALETFVSNFDEDRLADELADANAAVVTTQVAANNASTALANARVQTSDAQLATNVTNAIAAARADETAVGDAANALLDARAAANTALARDVTVDGSNVQVATDLRDALVAFTQTGGLLATTVTLNNAGTPGQTVGGLIDALNAALGSDTPATAVQTLLNSLGSADAATPTAVIGDNDATAAANAALQAELNTTVQRADLVNDALDAQAAIASSDNPRIQAVDTAEDAVVARQTAVDLAASTALDATEARQFADALAEFQEVVDNRDDLLEAIEDDFGPVELVDATTETATADDDIFLFDGSFDGLSTISGFGDAGDDVLFVGRGFAQVNLADDVDFGRTAQGNVNALEIFVQQNGADTILFIESEAFDGSTSNNAFGGSTIVLAGVDADDVVIDVNGFVRLSPEAEALVA